MEKSIRKNVVLSGIKAVLGILFPLITYKYATYFLGINNVGRIEFAKSVVSYFILLAGLGINTYAIRNGSAIRKNDKQLQCFFGEIFGINIVSCILSLFLLIGLVIVTPKFYSEKGLISIYAIQIILSVIGVEWIYVVFEDFGYLTTRTVICQMIALLLMVILVRKPSDIFWYAICMVIATYGANIFGFIYSRKYCLIRPIISKDILRHLPPILTLFANSIATTIYVNSDVTMLGMMLSNYDVGIYSASVKIYSAAKLLISTVMSVLLPRLSYYRCNGEQTKYLEILTKTIKGIIILILPCAVGISVESENLILLLSGPSYIAGKATLRILSIALAFSTVAVVESSAILLPCGEERYILRATILGAVANVIINFFIIPQYGYFGAGLSTMVSELIVAWVLFLKAKRILYMLSIRFSEDILPSILGCASIVLVSNLTKKSATSGVVELAICVLFSTIAYFTVVLALKKELREKVQTYLKQKIKP